MDRSVNKFRLASRELFNSYFLEHLSEDQSGWERLGLFDTVEESLFAALVTALSGIDQVPYRLPQPQILVRSSDSIAVPIMLNREIESGYWDHPVVSSDADTTFTFIEFFDWNQMSYRDNRYVRVIVKEWPGKPELVGKHALIESHYVTYEKV